jgi:hypothetical protein
MPSENGCSSVECMVSHKSRTPLLGSWSYDIDAVCPPGQIDSRMVRYCCLEAKAVFAAKTTRTDAVQLPVCPAQSTRATATEPQHMHTVVTVSNVQSE